MSSEVSTRKYRSEKLQGFLHTFFESGIYYDEKEVNGYLLVKYRLPNTSQTQIEIYRLPLKMPHGRFDLLERKL